MREILATKGRTVELHIGDQLTRLTHAEAERCVEQLLACLDYPEAVKMLWLMRTSPRGRVTHFYKHDGAGSVVTSCYRMYVYIGDKVLLAGPQAESPERAIALCKESYGGDVKTEPAVVEDQSSYAAAEKESLQYLLKQLAASEGKSVAQLVREHREARA